MKFRYFVFKQAYFLIQQQKLNLFVKNFTIWGNKIRSRFDFISTIRCCSERRH